MTLLFSLHATPHPKLWGKPCVRSVEPAFAGLYDETSGRILAPDHDAVREALPHYWRKAFDRGGRFWYDRNARMTPDGLKGSAPYLTLRGSRGRILATLYAIPYHFNAEG